MNNTHPTTFYIVRHGQTDWNVQRLLHGQTDIPLNAEGEKQAKALAEQLKPIKFDMVFSSDLLRAKRTAEIIVLERNLEVKLTKMIRERLWGEFEGKPSQALHEYEKLLKELTREEKIKHKPNNFIESEEEFISRIFTFLRETAMTYPGKNVLVTTHSGVIRMILIHLGVFTYEEANQLRMPNAGYIELNSDGTDFTVKNMTQLERRI